jgi:hypothetical protein
VTDTVAAEDVDRIFRSLSHWHSGAVRSLSVSLGWAEEPLRFFAQPFDYLSDALDDPSLSGDLARLAGRRAMRLARHHSRRDELLERLEGVDEAPWPQVRAALARTESPGSRGGSASAD